MLLSMTGFGKAVTELPERKITIEIKSLNSKQADISTRMPSSCRELELEMRQQIAKELKRGKIELSVMVEGTQAADCPHINLAVAESYYRQILEMKEDLGLPTPCDWYNLLLRLPETLKNDSENSALTEEIQQAALSTLAEAIERLTEFRRLEGAKLQDFFTEKINAISALLAQVEPYETERVGKIRQRIEENLANLRQVDIDKSRLEQEMIFYIEKLDVNEEKQRLGAHLNYFIETMNGEPGQGKKLGFISQEMGREINTLGSKSNHAEMQRIVVKMKDELEQIKEQVLNVL